MVSKRSTAINVSLGGVLPDDWQDVVPRSIDQNGEDRTDIIRDVFHATAAAPALGSVDITSLVMVLSSTVNIRVMYHELVYTLLGAENSPKTLVCRPTHHIHDDESEYLQEVANAWRQEHPGRRVQLEGIELYFQGDDLSAIMSLHTVDDVESIVIRTQQRMSEALLWTIVDQFRQVKRLKLANIEIDTMDEITNLADSQLEELVLVDMTLDDKRSFIKFLHALGDESTNLAKNLRRLAIYRRNDSDDLYALDEDAARALVEMLAKNRVLANISVTLLSEPEAMYDIHDELGQQNDVLVKRKLSEDEVQRLRARRLAFLSVVQNGDSACGQLDAMVLRNIFEFTMPFEYRDVESSFEPTDGDMDDDLLRLTDFMN